MPKSTSLTIETQTQNREVISLCHVNEKMIAIDTSLIANKMLDLNKELFDKISDTTNLIGGTVYRQEIVEINGNLNKAFVPINNSYEQRETEIAKLFFTDNVLLKHHRAINKYGRQFDFDPSLVSSANTGGYFDAKNLSPSDIESSTIISTVEEVAFLQRDGVKTFLIIDNLENKRSLRHVAYRIELIVSTSFEDFVKYVVEESEKSIMFLTDYLNSLEGDNYDQIKTKFNENFTNRIMNQLGVSGDLGSVNLSSPGIKSSAFGQAAIAYYNLSTLLTPLVEKKIYSQILETILPTNKTSPTNINLLIRNFSSLLDSVVFEYLGNSYSSGEQKSSTPNGKINTEVINVTSKQSFEIDPEILGYTVFSDLSGAKSVTKNTYKNRINAERLKYYPTMNISDSSNFLTPNERARLANQENRFSYLTPISLLMGTEVIKTERGMNNINIDQIRQFRLAKSIREYLKKTESFPESVASMGLTLDSLSSLNVTIAQPVMSIRERPPSENVDPLVDTKNFFGKSSVFSTNNPLELIKSFNRTLNDEERRILSILSDIIPRTFLRNPNSIDSIKQIQFSNPSSIVRELARSDNLDIDSIPPHVKYMMTSAFVKNPEIDPLQNSESRQLIEETQKNLFLIHALVKFERGENGFVDVHSPVYEPVRDEILNDNRPYILKAVDYEVASLGILKDNFLATIYSNFLYLRQTSNT